jgi:UDP:flavonoid glycosyltransferase YjiC (YdhE family)
LKILHLFSDWKWTGPSEPVLNLCKELEKRGHDVTLAYRKSPFPAEDSLEKRVFTERVKATDRFHLTHVLKFSQPSSLWDNVRDFYHLPGYLRQERFDILNVHSLTIYLLGGLQQEVNPSGHRHPDRS